MNRTLWHLAAGALAAIALSDSATAASQIGADGAPNPLDMSAATALKQTAIPKSATVQTLGARSTVSAGNSLTGAFELSSTTTVYLLVRGNSLGTLGVTPAYLDYPRVRLFNGQGQDLVFDQGGAAGFNGCTSNNAVSAPVVDFYANSRKQPAADRDACGSYSLAPGVYTFSVNPSIPGSTSGSGGGASAPSLGDVLFEVTLGASATPGTDNRSQTEKLIGGTWTYAYTIITTFTDSYSFATISGPNSDGVYYADGTDEFGGPVVGGYYPDSHSWGVLDPSIIIDKFYTFTFDDNNHVHGCYYQISPPGSTNLGSCYSMTGARFPAKALQLSSPEDRAAREAQMLEEAKSAVKGAPADPDMVERYMKLRRLLRR